MTTLHKITIVGASGRLGPYILQALHQSPSNFDITVIARETSTADYGADATVRRIPDDYPDDAMVEAFTGQDAVVLSLSSQAEHRHTALAQASIRAGVKFFVASVYGADPEKEKIHFFPTAKKNALRLRELRGMEREGGGWAWSTVCCGTFLDFCIEVNFYGIDPKAKTAKLWDDGNARFSATTRASIGRAVAGILEKPDKARNRKVFVSTTELTMNELVAAEQKVVGSQGWKFEYIKTDEEIPRLQRIVKTEKEFMPKMMAYGGLAFAASLKEEFEADFERGGALENEVFGVPREKLDDVVVRVLKE